MSETFNIKFLPVEHVFFLFQGIAGKDLINQTRKLKKKIKERNQGSSHKNFNNSCNFSVWW